jgi:hypothetical protein
MLRFSIATLGKYGVRQGRSEGRYRMSQKGEDKRVVAQFLQAYRELRGVNVEVVWKDGWYHVGYNPKAMRLSELKRLTRDLEIDLRDKRRQEMKAATEAKTTLVNVRWADGYLEAFECSQVRQGGQILWMRLTDGQNRTIPLVGVRWFSTDPESHAYKKDDPGKAV